MSTQTRRLHGLYHIECKWVDAESFDLFLHGQTKDEGGENAVIKVRIPFKYIPHLVRELFNRWVESRTRRLAEINEIDRVLPKEKP